MSEDAIYDEWKSTPPDKGETDDEVAQSKERPDETDKTKKLADNEKTNTPALGPALGGTADV